MDDSTYEKMMAMSTGHLARDQGWLDKLAIEGHRKEEIEAKAKYEREHPPARSQRDLELEARAFDLKMFGKTHMEKYARPIGADVLALPGDVPQVRGHSSADQRPVPPKHLKLQFHDAGSEPGCKMWKV
jgi:hypothetical protein